MRCPTGRCRCEVPAASGLLLRVGFVVAERVLFLPSMGYSLLLALVLQHVLPPAEDEAPPPDAKARARPAPAPATAIVAIAVALIVIGGFSVRWVLAARCTTQPTCPQDVEPQCRLGVGAGTFHVRRQGVSSNALQSRPAFAGCAEQCAHAPQRSHLRAQPSATATACRPPLICAQVQREFHQREAVRLAPLFVDAHINLGAMLYNQSRIDEALDVRPQAISWHALTAARRTTPRWRRSGCDRCTPAPL